MLFIEGYLGHQQGHSLTFSPPILTETLILPAHPSQSAKECPRKRGPACPAWESWWSGLSTDLGDMRPGNISVCSA